MQNYYLNIMVYFNFVSDNVGPLGRPRRVQHKGPDKHTPACNWEAMRHALSISRSTEPNVEPNRALTNAKTHPKQG